MSRSLQALVATSLAPGPVRLNARGRPVGEALQRAAVTSLARAFGEVLAFNFSEEMDWARGYSGVTPIDAGPREKTSFGRPLVDFATVWAHLDAREDEIVALANSDVIYVADPGVTATVLDAAQHGLVVFNRTETRNVHVARGPTFRVGYDLFVFHRSLLGKVRLDGLAFGVPWWDYALPVMAIAAGVPLFRGDPTSLRHYTHETVWSRELWREGLAAYMRNLERHAATPGRGGALVRQLASVVGAFAERRAVVPLFGAEQIDHAATLLALWNVSLIDAEAITL